jgi:hypothetical protein
VTTREVDYGQDIVIRAKVSLERTTIQANVD